MSTVFRVGLLMVVVATIVPAPAKAEMDAASGEEAAAGFKVWYELDPAEKNGRTKTENEEPAEEREETVEKQRSQKTTPPVLRFAVQNTTDRRLVFPRGGQEVVSGQAEGWGLQMRRKLVDGGYFLSSETGFKPHEIKSFSFQCQLSFPDTYTIRWWNNLYAADGTKDGKYVGTIRTPPFTFNYEASYEPVVRRSPVIVDARVDEAVDLSARDGLKSVRFSFLSVIKGDTQEKGFAARCSGRALACTWLNDYDFAQGQRVILYLTRDRWHRRGGRVRAPFTVMRLDTYSKGLSRELSALVAGESSPKEP